MALPRTIAWLSIPAALGAGVLYWTLVPGVHPGALPAKQTEAALQAGSATPSEMQEVARLSRLGAGGTQALIDAYARWARERRAVPARKLALNALFNEKNLPRKLSGVLAAVEADPTPPGEDPLWQHMVASLADVWRGDTLTRGMDLMTAETRPRAKRALISSFVAIVNSDRAGELTVEQSQQLGNSFIDLYQGLPGDQQPEVNRALRKVAGNDAADVMLGKALAPGAELEGGRQRLKDLENAQQALAKAPEAAPPDSVEEPIDD